MTTNRKHCNPRRALTAYGLCLAAAIFAIDSIADQTPALATAVSAMRELPLSGFTRARASMPLVAEAAGRIEEVMLDIGETVSKTGSFARLDDTFIRLELEENTVQMDRLRAQIDFDQRELQRYRELAKQKNTSASQLDTLERSLLDNTHALRALDVKGRILKERLERTMIMAPSGWRITARKIEPGQWVNAGETLGSAADFSTLLVPFALTPEEFSALRNDPEPLRLNLTDEGRLVPARLYRVNPAFDPRTRKIALELALDAAVEPPRGGLRTSLRLRLPEANGAVSLPAEAVQEGYEEYWVTRENGERLRVILLGSDQTDPTRVRVVAPALQPGDRIRLMQGS